MFAGWDLAWTIKFICHSFGLDCMVRHVQEDVGNRNQCRMFLVRGSWSARWGIDGHCCIRYGYLTSPQLALDFWAIQAVVIK